MNTWTLPISLAPAQELCILALNDSRQILGAGQVANGFCGHMICNWTGIGPAVGQQS